MQEEWSCPGDRVGYHREAHLRASLRATAGRLVYAHQQLPDRTYIVGSVRVVVDTAEESSCRVLANELDKQVATTRVLVEKVGHIVNKTGDDDERPLDTLVLDFHAGQPCTQQGEEEKTYSSPS